MLVISIYYYIWIGVAAQDKLCKYGEIILNAYREILTNKKHDQLLDQDKTIMSHIVNNDYPTEQHRISDVVVFLIAGHETTVCICTLYWIIYHTYSK